MPDLLSLSIIIWSQGFKLVATNVVGCMKGISLVSLWSVFSLLHCPAYEKKVEEIPHPHNMMKQLSAMHVISVDCSTSTNYSYLTR